jgi:tetratricopeptide (TPR) repeat protein
MMAEAHVSRQSGDFDKACSRLAAAAARFPNEPDPWREMARLAEEHHEWSLAEGCWRRFLALDDGQWWAYALLAATLLQQQRLDEAESVLRSASTRFPNEPGPWHDLARLEESRQRWAEAEAYWRRFLTIDETHWQIHITLAAVLRQQGRGEEAEAVLRSVTTLFPNETRPWHDLARLEESRQRWDEAAQHWRQFMALDDREWWVHDALAAVLREQGCLDQAEAVVSAAEDRFPDQRFTFAAHRASTRICEAMGQRLCDAGTTSRPASLMNGPRTEDMLELCGHSGRWTRRTRQCDRRPSGSLTTSTSGTKRPGWRRHARDGQTRNRIGAASGN